jgi:excisionase family DNA binding protein
MSIRPLGPAERLSLDALAQDPAKVSTLPAEVAATLASEAAGLLEALRLRAVSVRLTQTTAPTGSPRLLKIPQVAEYLQIRRGEVYEMIRRGELPTVQLGEKRGLRISEDDLNEFVADRKRLTRITGDTYSVYSSTRGTMTGRNARRGTSATPGPGRTDAGPVRRAHGRDGQHGGPVGTERGPHP